MYGFLCKAVTLLAGLSVLHLASGDSLDFSADSSAQAAIKQELGRQLSGQAAIYFPTESQYTNLVSLGPVSLIEPRYPC